MEKKRLSFVDVAKGIGIALVVLGHSFQPDDPIIFAVHMPLFFFISGYLFSAGDSIGGFVARKFRGLYVPFAFWNVLLLIVAAAFGWFGMSLFSTDLLRRIGLTLALSHKSQFLGATWFLGGMFAVTILYRLSDAALAKVPVLWRRVFQFVVFAGISAFSFSTLIPYSWNRPLVLSFFFGVGALARQFEKTFPDRMFYRLWAVPIALAIFFPIALTQVAHQGPNKYSSPILFLICGLAGTYALIWFSRWLDASSSRVARMGVKVLSFFGAQSLDIVIWQFVFMRFVVWAEVALAGEPLTAHHVLSYYPVYSSEGCRWIVYFLVGMLAPVGWCSLLRMIPFVKRYHIA